jgi:hypothetical protein
MSKLHPCHFSMLQVHAACSCNMYCTMHALHAHAVFHAACLFWMSILHVHSPCPCCISM